MAGTKLSPRLRAIVDALPLGPGRRVLEIGCGPGAMAREMALRCPGGYVLGIDRSAKATAQAEALSTAGHLRFRCVAIEDFQRAPGEAPFDIVIAVRVGALDGRHPGREEAAWTRIRAVRAAGGQVFVDGRLVA